MASHQERVWRADFQLVAPLPRGLGVFGTRGARQGGQVHTGRGAVQFGTAGARQRQQLVEHMPRTQGVLANAVQRLRLRLGRQLAPQRTGLQRNGRQRRAQLVCHFVGQSAFTGHGRLLAVQQGVDGSLDRLEFLPGVLRGQTLVCRGVQRSHIV